MSFLLPLAGWGLLTLPLILLLHLLHQRQPQLPISSLQLWRGLQQKKRGQLPRVIPFSFILLLQLLIATTLTLGLAQPVFSFLLAPPHQTIFILDTTTSMLAEDASARPARRFDTARRLVEERLQALSSQDTFTIINLKAQPEILLSGTSEQKNLARSTLDKLVPGGTGLNFPAALTLANGLLDPKRQNRIVILTDGSYPLEANDLPAALAPVEWQIIPSPRPVSSPNQALLNVSARLLPDGRHRLFARIVNYSDAPVTRTVQILADNRLFDKTTVEPGAQAETARFWTLPAAAATATVELVEPDALPLDNRAELLLSAAEHYRVRLVSAAPDTLARALEAQPGVEVTLDRPSARIPDAKEFDLTVFEGEGLPPDMTDWPDGNILVVNPPLGHSLLLTQKPGYNLRPDPATASSLLDGVDLSGVYFNYAVQFESLPAWAELDLSAASPPTSLPHHPLPLIFHGNTGSTHLVVWAFNLSASNLPARLALPLLMANTLQSLFSPAPPPVVPVGEPVPLNGSFSIEIPGGQRLFPPPGRTGWGGLFTHTQQPGLYKIYNQPGKPVAGFAVHAGSALESNLTHQLNLQALNLERSTFNPLPPRIEYIQFWPWLAGLALLMMTIEGWLAWRR